MVSSLTTTAPSTALWSPRVSLECKQNLRSAPHATVSIAAIILIGAVLSGIGATVLSYPLLVTGEVVVGFGSITVQTAQVSQNSISRCPALAHIPCHRSSRSILTGSLERILALCTASTTRSTVSSSVSLRSSATRVDLACRTDPVSHCSCLEGHCYPHRKLCRMDLGHLGASIAPSSTSIQADAPLCRCPPSFPHSSSPSTSSTSSGRYEYLSISDLSPVDKRRNGTMLAGCDTK